MKIKTVQISETEYAIRIGDEIFRVESGCSMLGEAGSLMRSIDSKINDAIRKTRRAQSVRQGAA